MGRSAVLLALALAALLAPGAGAPLRRKGSRHKLLMVSFDGFRWNYDQDVDTPNLDAMALDGVKARYMTPAFVTTTSPCHFTLVTGEHRAGAWGQGGAERLVNGQREPAVCTELCPPCRIGTKETKEGMLSLGDTAQPGRGGGVISKLTVGGNLYKASKFPAVPF